LARRQSGRGDDDCRGNPGGSPEATRRAFNKRFLLDLAEDWQQHGREVFKRPLRSRNVVTLPLVDALPAIGPRSL